MKISKAEYIGSFWEIEKCPTDKPEIAFIGRSNVGKSSMINFLCDNKNLAKISSKPGKTQTINYYMINYKWYLVDLPGYGFSLFSKKKRIEFDKLIRNYIFRSPNLFSLFVLVDSSISPQSKDIEFINFLGLNEIPFSIIFTKIDKVSQNQLQKNLKAFNKELAKTWEEFPKYFLTSVKQNIGREEVLEYIETILKNIQ